MDFIDFLKYHGNGNDFVMIDDRENKFSLSSSLVKKICHRNLGVGADGVILLQKSDQADVRMRILNSDGSEAESCGNGLSCLMGFLSYLGFGRKKYTIETKSSVVSGDFLEDKVVISVKNPQVLKADFNLVVEGKSYDGLFYINSGVPHLVCFVNDVENVDVFNLGRKLRNHDFLRPHGANVDFVQIMENSNSVLVRTYERGVEAETLACGTGAIAVAVATALKLKKFHSPIEVNFKCGKILIQFTNLNGKISDVNLINSVNFVYAGKFLLNS